jgi:hypothetical protein
LAPPPLGGRIEFRLLKTVRFPVVEPLAASRVRFQRTQDACWPRQAQDSHPLTLFDETFDDFRLFNFEGLVPSDDGPIPSERTHGEGAVTERTRPSLSIIVPVYNEQQTVIAAVERLAAIVFSVDREIVIVNDGSSDGTAHLLEPLANRQGITVLTAPQNEGKGAAVRRGIAYARGSIIAIQDADLELDPAQLPTLVAPVLEGRASVVYGSRFLAGKPAMSSLAYFANRVLTGLTNLLCGGRLTDMETCYKIVPTDLMRSLQLRSPRFDIEAEISAKLLVRRLPILELPIAVLPRSKAAGKKIGWRDAIQAISALVRYGTVARLRLIGSRLLKPAGES